MPKNYQISQFSSPLGRNGWIDIECQGKKKHVRIHEIHLEEDAGKMIHTGTVSLLDYNRAGVALLEIVTEPDMESGEEAELFIQQLRRLVRYLGVCDGNMEEGSLRADANVSINLPGRGLGKKVEIKNLNSSRFVRLGLDYEIRRQGEVLDEGREVVQETRLWNENRDRTEAMRTKENAQDYRYFPEPDLPVFVPGAAFLKSVEDALVELPSRRASRIMDEYGLNEEQTGHICDEKALADYFEEAVSFAVKKGLEKRGAAGRVANWLLSDIKHILSREGIALKDLGLFKLSPPRLASLTVMSASGQVSGKNARQAVDAVLKEDKEPEVIIKERGWEQLRDPVKIAETVKAVCASEAAAFAGACAARAEGNAGRRATLEAFLVGKVLAATGGRADPRITGAQIADMVNSGP
jgi:aspartyl-tRNA(Asn)/glutamyl-tRNA(Gln) amidotransferase subunit B